MTHRASDAENGRRGTLHIAPLHKVRSTDAQANLFDGGALITADQRAISGAAARQQRIAAREVKVVGHAGCAQLIRAAEKQWVAAGHAHWGQDGLADGTAPRRTAAGKHDSGTRGQAALRCPHQSHSVCVQKLRQVQVARVCQDFDEPGQAVRAGSRRAEWRVARDCERRVLFQKPARATNSDTK